ncbi:MAG: 50S ribosomal protein L25 [Deltaproteobacteria bacterium]|nr:50S ribosomal protein L25 [Deltaproteobacteria bacterium]
MEQLHLQAFEREKVGKSEARRLRVKGLVPAVLYGKGINPRSLSLKGEELDKILSTSAGMNALITLNVEGDKDAPPRGDSPKVAKKGVLVVMLKDYQADIISRQLTHVDLLKVDLKEKITVMIPVHLTGKSQGVVKGGLIEQAKRELEVKCLPTNIPNHIEVDITPLDIGDSIHIDQIQLPEGVEAIRETNFTIVAIVAPAAEEVAPTPAEGAVPAEGAAAPAEGASPKGESPKPGEAPKGGSPKGGAAPKGPAPAAAKPEKK